MAHVRLEAIECQQHPPLGLGEALEAGGVCERESDEFLITLHEVQHRAGGDGDAAALELLMDLRHTPVLGIAQRPDEGNNIETKLVLGECETAFLLRPVGFADLRTGRIGTPSDLKCETQYRG